MSGYEVVIRAGDGLDKEHAELLRKEMVETDFSEDAVFVREASDE